MRHTAARSKTIIRAARGMWCAIKYGRVGGHTANGRRNFAPASTQKDIAFHPLATENRAPYSPRKKLLTPPRTRQQPVRTAKPSHTICPKCAGLDIRKAHIPNPPHTANFHHPIATENHRLLFLKTLDSRAKNACIFFICPI